jgi:hypothetical protein
MKEDQTSLSVPKTSSSNGTNLPNLAEIYSLYYDRCVDRGSSIDTTDPRGWKAFKGRLQFCVQTMNASYASGRDPTPKILHQDPNLHWYTTTKRKETAFCTKIEQEKDDFCVAESVMLSLSSQLNSVFNVTALFNASDSQGIRYSSEWGTILAHDSLGEYKEVPRLCTKQQRRGSAGQNPNPFSRHGLYGFEERLGSVATTLTNA